MEEENKKQTRQQPEPQNKNAVLFTVILGIVSVVVVIVLIVGSLVSKDSSSTGTDLPESIDPEIEGLLPPPSEEQEEAEVPKEAGQGSSASPGYSRPAGTNTFDPIAPEESSIPSLENRELVRLQQQYLGQLERLIYGKQNTGEDLSKLLPLVTVSDFAGKITIRSVARSSSGNTNDEYVVLSAKKELPTSFQITGLRLRSLSTGQQVTIGEGVILPFTNQLNFKGPIFINPGATIYVITGSSPVGYSFQPNICSGYWSQFQKFKPSLRQSCPRIIYDVPAELPIQMSDSCFDYIKTLGTCKIHVDDFSSADSVLSDPYYKLPIDCRQFIERTAGYNNCITLHKNDEGFYSNEWRIYLGRSSTVWKNRREIIQLIDSENRIIAQYSY